MDVGKKLGRFKQWAGEKMGGEAKTDTSEEFKMLQSEMDLRHEGAHWIVKLLYHEVLLIALCRHG
jgi:hypothetical protein